MNSLWGRSILGVVTLATSILFTSNRAAVAAPDPAETAQYRSLLEEAVSEYDARRYEEARALFRRAHDLSPNARTLRGIGMASFELREYVEALRALEGALVDPRRPLTSQQRQQVEGLLDRTRAFVGRFAVHLTPKDATLRVDGAPVALEADGTLLLSFGRHSVTAEAPNGVIENRELNVIGGERQELSFQLHRSVDEPAGRGAAGEVVAAPPLPPATEEHRASKGGGYFLLAGMAAAGAVASGYFWWHGRNVEINRCDAANTIQPNPPICPNRSTLVLEKAFAIGVTAGLAAGAAALSIIGTVVWSKTHKPEPGTALACSPGPGAVHCALQFSF